MLNQPPGKFHYLKQYTRKNVKAVYGRYGRDSHLNPGVLYPKKDELNHLIQFEKAFHPELSDLIRWNEDRKKALADARAEREKEVLDNLKKLPEAMKSFFDKIRAKELEKEEWQRQKDIAIEEVRAVLGYTASPSDPKFQEALMKREEEKIKALKLEARKKRENAALDALLEAGKATEV